MISIGRGGKFNQSPNTKAEFDRDVTLESVRDVLEMLAQGCFQHPDRVCYVFGMGAQPKATYTYLQGKEGIQVLYSQSLLPWYGRWLGCFVGSFEGLVRVSDFSQLPAVFLRLIDRSMAGVYIFSASHENDFLRVVCSNTSERQFDFGVKSDPSYCFYVVDADNSESRTGLIEIISYGITTPNELIPA